MKFYLALLFVVCAHALARDENSRAPKAAAPSTNAPLYDAVLLTNTKSALFGNCLAKGNTRKMQYSYISEPAQDISFVQHEVSRFAQGLSPINWQREIQCNDIIDCARASKNYTMFQYNGQTCRMVDTTYADISGNFCEEVEAYTKDIVYINNGVQPKGCPAHTDVVNGDEGCLGVIRMDVPFDYKIASPACGNHYVGGVFHDNLAGVRFDAVRNIMRNKKYQGDFFVGISADDGYKWEDESPVNASYFAVTPQDPYFQQLVVMSSRHDYLLVAQNDTRKITGFICIGLPF